VRNGIERAPKGTLTHETVDALDVQASTSKGIVGLETTVGTSGQQNSKTSAAVGKSPGALSIEAHSSLVALLPLRHIQAGFVGSAKDEANVVVIKVVVADRQGARKVNTNEVVDGSGDSVRELGDALAGIEAVTADNPVGLTLSGEGAGRPLPSVRRKELGLRLASNTVDENGAGNVGVNRADIQLAVEARQRTRSQVLVGEAIRVRVKTAVEAIASEASIAHAAVSGGVNGGRLGPWCWTRGRHTKDGATSLNTLSVGTAAA
jgi:hypothetical protein